MPLSDTEFEQIMSDPTKRIVGDIVWSDDQDHLPTKEFRATIESSVSPGLFVHVTWRPQHEDMFLVLVHPDYARIAGLCVGFDGHRDPDRARRHRNHWHRWRQRGGTKWVEDEEQTALSWDLPLQVWSYFCETLNIRHLGTMAVPVAERRGSQ